MKPLILAFLSKRVRSSFVIFIITSLFSQPVQAQLIPGFRANGRPMNQGDTVTVCIGSIISYVSTAQGNSTINWRFALSSTTTSAINNPTVTYNAGGLDTTWQVITSGTNRDSMYILVRVNTIKPVAGFTFTPNNQCADIPVVFTNTSSGNIIGYAWTFETGVFSNLINPSYQFLNAVGNGGTTTYPVKLVVTNDQVCKDSAIQNVTVNRIPDATISRGAPDILFGTFNGVPTFRKCDQVDSFRFRFVNSSSTPGIISNYIIKWGDGSLDTSFATWPVNTSIIGHTYQRGQYRLQVFAYGTNTCIGIKNYNVFLGRNPAGGVLTPGNTAVCNSSPANTITFPIGGTSSNSSGTIYTITINDGSPPVVYQHPPPTSYTHIFTTTSCGTISSDGSNSFQNSFSANLTISNPCDISGSTVIPITVSGKPRAQFVAPQNVCAGSNVSIFSSSNFGNVVSGGVCTNNGKLVWNISPGTYTSASQLGNINGALTNPIIWTAGSSFINVIFNQSGIYSIKLYVANDANCGMDSITKTICVRLPPTASFTKDKQSGCAPDTVSFTNTSPIGTCLGETYNWAVSFQDIDNCGTSSGFNFVGGTGTNTRDAKIRFFNAGRYIITLTQTAIASGCPSAIFRDTFYVKSKPRVTINPINAICVNNSITPTSIVSNCNSSQTPTYIWTFTNGLPATAATLVPGSILYTTVGSHPITLSADNECGITTATTTTVVTNLPVANAGSDKNICSGVPTPIGVSSGNSFTYSWSPATGLSNPNIAVPTATLNYNGVNADTTFTFIVTVAAGANCTNRDTVNVVVKRKPIVVVTPPGAAICNGQSVTLIATGATSYVWAPPATLNVSNRDTVIASPTGNTTYTVTGTENGCTATAQVPVTVTATVIVNAGPDTLVCNSSTAVQLTGTPSGGIWSGHPNVSPGGVFNPAAAGNGAYTLYYTAGTGNCTRRDSMVVTVVSSATANAGTDSTFCQQPGTVQLNGLPVSGSWSGSPLVTNAGIFNTNTPGTYTLIYRIGSGSCIARDTVIITVNTSIANNVISANQTLCAGAQPVTITGQPITGGNGAPQYQWQQSTDSLAWTDIAGAITQNYLPPAATQIIYYRRLATTASCTGQTNASLPVKITVNPDARALFNPTSTVGCIPFVITPAIINLTPFNNAVSEYRWFINGVFYSNLQAFPNYTMAVPGDSITIKLVAISRFGCKNDSIQYGFKTVVRPLPAFTQSDSLGCGPLNITFTNQTPNAAQYSYQWNFGTGQTSTLQQPAAITFPVNPQGGDTIYTVRFITISQCTADTLLRYVRVKGKPKALFTPDRTTGCSSYNFMFTNTSRSSGITSYIWDFGDGSPLLPTNAPQVNHVYTVGNTTTFRVKLKATNECGTDSLIYNLVVTPITIRPDFAINGNESFGCLPHTVSFINNSQGGTLYTINFGDGNIAVSGFNGIDTIRHTYTDTGVFTVRLRATNSCSDTTDIEYVTVRRKPIVAFTATPLIGCTGDTIRYTNGSDTGISYNWRFGDGGTALIRNPTHIYTTGGTFRTQLTGRKTYTGGSCADSAFKDIVIRDTLAGSFTAGTVAATCLPASISFVNDNRPAVLTTWTFGDGGTATGDSVNHTYTQAGTYVVKMISRGIAGCTYTATRTINIVGLSGTLQYNSGYLCPGIPLRMEVQSTTAMQIRYFFGNGDSLTTTNAIINYTYPQPGIYVPYAYLLSANCLLRLNVGDTVRVDRLRTGFRTAQQQTCGRTTVTFTDTSNAFFGIRSWLWNFGDGTTSTQQNPVHTYTQNGTYPVRLRITGNSNCVDTITIPVTVTVRNFPVSTIAGDTVACIGQPLALAAIVQSANAVASYNWDFGNGTPGTGQNVTAVYNTIGTYTVRLITRTAFGCADTVYKTVRSNNSPIVSAGPDVTICRGQSIQIGAIGATTWQWSPLQGLSCTTCANPVANPLFTTSYVVTGSFGALCRANDTIRVQVIQPFNMTVSPTTIVCIGDSVPLFATGAYTYSWSPAIGLNNANLSNPTAKPTVTTLYQVIGRDNFNCFTDTDYVRVNVGQYPTVDLGTGSTVVAGTTITLNPTITNGPITRYRWTPPTDLSCSNCPRPTATINNNISYKLEAENAFGCIGSDTINFKVNCDPNQLFIPNAFSPDGDGTNDVLMVRGKGISAVKYFRVFNRWGQMVFERSNINVNDAQQGWDGRINGVPAQPDVYVYTAEAVCTAGGTFVYKGNVTLVK